MLMLVSYFIGQVQRGQDTSSRPHSRQREAYEEEFGGTCLAGLSLQVSREGLDRRPEVPGGYRQPTGWTERDRHTIAIE
jgi:hypothetical protein